MFKAGIASMVSSNGQVIVFANLCWWIRNEWQLFVNIGVWLYSGEVMKRNAGNYGWECVADEDTTYDGNFATSNQVCSKVKDSE